MLKCVAPGIKLPEFKSCHSFPHCDFGDEVFNLYKLQFPHWQNEGMNCNYNGIIGMQKRIPMKLRARHCKYSTILSLLFCIFLVYYGTKIIAGIG